MSSFTPRPPLSQITHCSSTIDHQPSKRLLIGLLTFEFRPLLSPTSPSPSTLALPAVLCCPSQFVGIAAPTPSSLLPSLESPTLPQPLISNADQVSTVDDFCASFLHLRSSEITLRRDCDRHLFILDIPLRIHVCSPGPVGLGQGRVRRL